MQLYKHRKRSTGRKPPDRVLSRHFFGSRTDGGTWGAGGYRPGTSPNCLAAPRFFCYEELGRMYCDTPFKSWSHLSASPLLANGLACGLPFWVGLMLDIEFVVRGDPVGKARHRRRKGGGHYTPKKTASYETLVSSEAALAMLGQAPATGPIAVEIDAVFALPKSTPKKHQVLGYCQKKPDIDNIAKSILDGLQPKVMGDDKQVALLSIAKFNMPVREGWAVVRVREVDIND